MYLCIVYDLWFEYKLINLAALPVGASKIDFIWVLLRFIKIDPIIVVFPVPAYPFSTNNKSLELSKMKQDNFFAQSLCFSVNLNGKDETIKSLKSDDEIKK